VEGGGIIAIDDATRAVPSSFLLFLLFLDFLRELSPSPSRCDLRFFFFLAEVTAITSSPDAEIIAVLLERCLFLCFFFFFAEKRNLKYFNIDQNKK
jgi:hypothetical protein